MSESHVSFEGELQGHRDWVTSLSCPQTTDSAIKVVSASRDCTLVSWGAAAERHSTDEAPAVPMRRLEGHTGFVQDVALTNNGEYALSASWDRSMRLWNLKTGECFGKFLGHEKDVMSAAFSPDNRHILSGSRDGKMKVWNVKAECVYTLEKDGHNDWVSCVRFSPAVQAPVIVSASWDNTIKVWNLAEFKCMHTLEGHTGYVSTVTVSPDGSLCASAGKDGKAKLWDLTRGEHLYELDCQDVVSQLAFSPNRYWLCAATASAIKIFDLESKKQVAELMPEVAEKEKAPKCLCISWSADGNTLYSGYTDSKIRVWGVHDN